MTRLQGSCRKMTDNVLLRSDALSLATEIGQARWLMFEQGTTTVSKPFVIVVVSG
jgi:hypothetical protein